MSGDEPAPRIDLVVVHETNGRKYFEALLELKQRRVIRSLTFVEASVLWKFAHSLFRERRPLRSALLQAGRNLKFRLTCGHLRGKVILIGLPPWDVRFLFYARLRRHNHLIYNTSWPYWSGSRVPRPGGAAGPYLQRKWLEILRERDVDVVAVISAAADAVGTRLGPKIPITIPHVVSDAFFAHRAMYRKPFHVLLTGELIERRGLHLLAEAMVLLAGEPVVVDIVGDGQLREVAIDLVTRTGGTWHRHISGRDELARVMASCQLLVSPSRKTARWEELFGMAIIEAMACGLPCIVSNHVGPRSIIESGVNGVLLGDASASAVADNIRYFLRDEHAWQAMSNAARARAEMFRLAKVAERWERVLVSAAVEIANRPAVPSLFGRLRPHARP